MLGIYLHVPFCIKKCNYCDFVSVEHQELIDGYFTALKQEIAATGRMYDRKVDSIFFGGGTPSFPEASYIVKTLEQLRNAFEVVSDAEITLEANPCSLTEKKLAAYRDAGVNRLSIGLQAAQDELLAMLGRQHTQEQFWNAFQLARNAGFRNINVDLIYALPGQTMTDWQETLDFVLEVEPEHISAYALKIEEGTPLHRAVQEKVLIPADEELDLAMYHVAQKTLEESGYINYEISNFAKADYPCRHNLKYWNVRDYLGLGAAAHSCIEHIRFANTENIEEYITNMSSGKLRYTSSEFLSERERILEYIMLKLRLKDGFTFFDYKSRFEEDFRTRFVKALEKAISLGLAEADDRGVWPTKRGFDLQNQLVSLLIQNL